MPTATANRPANSARAHLVESLRQAPATIPALVALALFLVWSTDQAGYPLTHWAPGGLIVLALLLLTALIVPPQLAEIPLAVRIAILCLAAYTALSFLSILWAGVPGDAWEGANRTLLYLLVFVLFATWPQRGSSAALVLTAWTVAMVGLAAFTALHVNSGSIARLLTGARLLYPAGYPNASAAQWLMAFWPAVLLARSERLWWWLRGLLAGGSVLLAAVALLSQSRGSLFATPVMLVLVFALLPGRLRTFMVLVPVAVGVGAIVPVVLRVGSRLEEGGNARHALHSATLAMFVAALAVGLVVAGMAAFEGHRSPSPRATKCLRQVTGIAATLTLVAILAGGWVAAGNPVARVEHGWQTFKGGYAADNQTGNRLVSGLGSNRYDFYRVALDEFVAHPLLGIGADNFAAQYLRHGRSLETPHYPHSIELRTLTETGLVGALLALVGLGAALVAASAGVRRSDPLGRAVTAAALAGFGYWVVHGSVDWFWEFAGLGAPAFALLGLSCALAPRRVLALSPSSARAPVGVSADADARPDLARPVAAEPTPSMLSGSDGDRGGRRLWRLTLAVTTLVAAALIIASFVAPWLSQREVQSAARVWPTAPAVAYKRLNDAASLNPLSDEPYLVAGSIALRFGELTHADREFALALGRVPDDAYATLERGAIASSTGHQQAALLLLTRAAQLNPRSRLTRQALQLVRRGQRVDVAELNRVILHEAQQLS